MKAKKDNSLNVIVIENRGIFFKEDVTKANPYDMDIYDVISYYNQLLKEHQALQKKCDSMEADVKVLDSLLTLLDSARKKGLKEKLSGR